MTNDTNPAVRRQPMQPIEVDAEGVARFRCNAVVKFLLDAGPFDMNSLAMMGFSDEDRTQFAQLIGYSVGGLAELSYVSDQAIEASFEMSRIARGQSKEDGDAEGR